MIVEFSILPEEEQRLYIDDYAFFRKIHPYVLTFRCRCVHSKVLVYNHCGMEETVWVLEPPNPYFDRFEIHKRDDLNVYDLMFQTIGDSRNVWVSTPKVVDSFHSFKNDQADLHDLLNKNPNRVVLISDSGVDLINLPKDELKKIQQRLKSYFEGD